jgi:hypothetical protein
MATNTTYSSWIETTGDTKVRSELYTSTSQSSTSFSIYAKGVMNVVKNWYTEAKITGTLSATSYSSTSTTSSARRPGSGLSDSNTDNYAPTRSNTYTYTRKTSAYTVTISYKIKIAANSKTSTTSQTFTVPALEKYTITYKSGYADDTTTSTQTKYYGNNITLKDSWNSRTNYSLIGWNTEEDGTGTSYALGATFSGNANTTLYAQWHLDYIKPTISDFKAERVTNTGAVSDTGEYVKIQFAYTGGSLDGGTNYITPQGILTIGDTQYTLTFSDGNNVFNWLSTSTFTINNSYEISATIYDENDIVGVSAYGEISSSIFPIDLLGDGSGMGLMHVAIEGQTLTLGKTYFDDGAILVLDTTSATDNTDEEKAADARIQAALSSLGWSL